MIREILLLGNPELYKVADEVTADDMKYMDEWVRDLHDTLMEYKSINTRKEIIWRSICKKAQPSVCAYPCRS